MVRVRPFHAVTYPDGVDLNAVTAPPYDVISAAGQQALYDRHPHNVLRLTLNQRETGDTEASNVYTRARDFWQQWRAENHLTRQDEAAFWAYSQTFTGPDGVTHTRNGLIVLIHLEPLGEGVPPNQVLPHETTLPTAKGDRLYLTQATTAWLSPVFGVYRDPDRAAERLVFDASATSGVREVTDPDGVIHRLWPVTDAATCAHIQKTLGEVPVMIADGHHRYETALAYQRQARAAMRERGLDVPPEGQLACDWFPMFVSNIDDPGLAVYPTHRVMLGWPEGWDTQKVEAALAERFHFDTEPSDAAAFGFQVPGGPLFHLRLKSPDWLEGLPKPMHPIDTAILEHVVFEKLLGKTAQALKTAHLADFVRGDAAVEQTLANNTCEAVFWMGTPPLAPILEAVAQGHRLPMKSTYFYPKILDGLVMMDLTVPEGELQALPNNLFGPGFAQDCLLDLH